MHPRPTPTRLPRWGPRRGLRCSSFKYWRYSQSSRLARGAPRPSRCDARLSPRAARARREISCRAVVEVCRRGGPEGPDYTSLCALCVAGVQPDATTGRLHGRRRPGIPRSARGSCRADVAGRLELAPGDPRLRRARRRAQLLLARALDVVQPHGRTLGPCTVAPRTLAPRLVGHRLVAPHTLAPRTLAPRLVAPRTPGAPRTTSRCQRRRIDRGKRGVDGAARGPARPAGDSGERAGGGGDERREFRDRRSVGLQRSAWARRLPAS